MTKAEKFVEDMEMIIDDNPEWYRNRKTYDRVVALFQDAINYGEFEEDRIAAKRAKEKANES